MHDSAAQLIDAIRTTRAMRRLDPDLPVSDEDIHTMIDAAIRAPSGGNEQPVRWIVVRDRELRRSLGDLYRTHWNASLRTRYVTDEEAMPSNVRRMLRSGDHLGEHFGDSPVIIVVAAKQRTFPASVYPAVQNLMLTGRVLGLGTTLTTIHMYCADEIKALLGMPPESEIYAMVPVGYPLGKWGVPERRPVDRVAYRDRWGEPIGTNEVPS